MKPCRQFLTMLIGTLWLGVCLGQEPNTGPAASTSARDSVLRLAGLRIYPKSPQSMVSAAQVRNQRLPNLMEFMQLTQRIVLEMGAASGTSDSVDSLKKLISLYHDSGERRSEGVCLLRLGNAEAQRGMYGPAGNHYREAASIATQLSDRELEGAALNNVAVLAAASGDYASALTGEQSALKIYRALLTALASQDAKKQPAQYELSREFAERYAVSLGAERALTNMASINGHIGQYRLAIDQYQQALALYPRNDAPAGAGEVLHGLAGIYRALGQSDQAIQLERRSAQAGSGRLLTLSTFRGGSIVLSGTSPTAVVPSAGAPSLVPSMLGAPGHRPEDIGFALQQGSESERKGDAVAAAASYGRAGMIADELASPDDQRRVYSNLQRLSVSRDAPDLAIFYGKRAVNAVQAVRGKLATLDREAKKSFLADNRALYQTLADLLISAQRLPEAEQVLRLLKEDEGAELTQSPDSAGYGRIPYSQVEATFVGRFDALAQAARARNKEYLASKDASGSPYAWGTSSRIELAEAEILKAQLDDLRYTLAVLRKLHSAGPNADPEIAAAFEAELENAKQVLRLLKAKSLMVHRTSDMNVPEPSDEDMLRAGGMADALLVSLRNDLLDTGSPEEKPERFAPGYLRELQENVDSIESGFPRLAELEAEKVALLRKSADELTAADRQKLQGVAVATNMLKGQLSTMQTEAATHRSWVARSPQLYTDAERKTFASLDSRLTQAGAKFAALTGTPDNHAYGSLAATGLIPGSSSEIVSSNPQVDPRAVLAFAAAFESFAGATDLSAFERQRGEVDADLRAALGNHPAVVFSEDDRRYLEAPRRLIEKWPDGVAAVYYLTTDKRVRILVVTAKGRVARESPIGRATLDEKISAYSRTLQNNHLDPRAQARELYEMLFQPIAADLEAANTKTIMLSLDGRLRYLPFAALYDGSHWLVERYALDLYTTAAPDALAARPQPRWSIAAFGNASGGSGFSPLPAVRAELDGIVSDGRARGHGAMQDEMYLDRQFTASTLRSVLKRRYPVIHIASHFVFRAGSAADSFLLLGDGSQLSLAALKAGGYRFDGVDLLSLSACETALDGRDGFGQEIDGLGALAQAQGAAAVLATLWSVADESTGIFMRKLYALRESRSLSRAEALRQAQLEFIHGSSSAGDPGATRGFTRLNVPRAVSANGFVANASAPYAHPFYWAPFLLMGNWL